MAAIDVICVFVFTSNKTYISSTVKVEGEHHFIQNDYEWVHPCCTVAFYDPCFKSSLKILKTFKIFFFIVGDYF